jgi:hypothetical protein
MKESAKKTTKNREYARYPEATANREATGEGLLAVLVSHSSGVQESFLLNE